LAASKPELLNLLGRLVNIDSGTGSEIGLDAVGAVVADELKKLGMRVEFSSAAPAAGIHTGDEYAELNSIAPRLYLLTRMIIDLSGKKLRWAAAARSPGRLLWISL
jgi:acetylornithine deacetylase/succinyl-diaminopimelate desuccinylase-like protein